METPLSIEVVREFLSIATEGPPPPTEQLLRALDDLTNAYHRAPSLPFREYPAPPNSDFGELYKLLSSRFPQLGLYAAPEMKVVLQDVPLVGDAIDDLADIVRDLRDVCWMNSNVSPQDANWHFRNTFETHWGQHLRDLSGYLHHLQFGYSATESIDGITTLR